MVSLSWDGGSLVNDPKPGNHGESKEVWKLNFSTSHDYPWLMVIGTYFFHILGFGNIIIPTDFRVLKRGFETTNQIPLTIVNIDNDQ